MTPESSALRESIRQGLVAAHVDRAEFDWAVARVYELEREEERETVMPPRMLAAERADLELEVEFVEVCAESRAIYLDGDDHACADDDGMAQP